MAHAVTDPGETPFEYKQIIEENQYNEARDLRKELEAAMAEYNKKLLENIDVDEINELSREQLKKGETGQKEDQPSWVRPSYRGLKQSRSDLSDDSGRSSCNSSS